VPRQTWARRYLRFCSHGGVVELTGLKGILDRYQQVLPKFIFSETEAIYAGKTLDLIPKVSEVVRDLSSKGLGHVIFLPGIKSGQEVSQEVVNAIPLRSASILSTFQRT
jgi:hypothetical protein